MITTPHSFNIREEPNRVRVAIVGLVGGDEGKGKIVDEYAARAMEMDNGRVVVVRFQGGCNAGHTIYVRKDGLLQKLVTHGAPSGVPNGADMAIAPQAAYDPIVTFPEIKGAIDNGYDGRVLISERVGVLMDYHKRIDAFREDKGGVGSIGSTKSGIAPFYEDNARKTTRITFGQYVSDGFADRLNEVVTLKSRELEEAGVLTGDGSLEHRMDVYVQKLLAEHDPVRRELKQFRERLEYRMQEYLKSGHIILEGAQGTILDVDMGTIPGDTTSSHLLAPHAFPSLLLPRGEFDIIGVEKVYPSRVGQGDLVTLARNEFGERTVDNAGEYGATTGRRRRIGYPDWVYTRYAAMANDCDGIYIMRIDNVQDEELRACIAYKHLDGTINDEVSASLHGVEPVYDDQTYKWHLWNGPTDLSKPEDVDAILRPHRMHYVHGGHEVLPQDLRNFRRDHDEFVRTPTIGLSISPVRGETVLLEPGKY